MRVTTWLLAIVTVEVVAGFVVRHHQHLISSSTQAGSSYSPQRNGVSKTRLFLFDQAQSTPKRTSKPKVPKITTVEKTEDFLKFLNEDDRLCVIKFHASWCKSCQKFGVKYKKLAMEEGDLIQQGSDATDPKNVVRPGSVRFAEVEFAANARLCRSLGIKRLPNVHIYKGSIGRISAFPCGPAKFPILEEKLDKYKQMSDEELELEKALEEGSVLGDEIVKDLKAQFLEDIASQNLATNNNGPVSSYSTAKGPTP